jgi:hypothetical protein
VPHLAAAGAAGNTTSNEVGSHHSAFGEWCGFPTVGMHMAMLRQHVHASQAVEVGGQGLQDRQLVLMYTATSKLKA